MISLRKCLRGTLSEKQTYQEDGTINMSNGDNLSANIVVQSVQRCRVDEAVSDPEASLDGLSLLSLNGHFNTIKNLKN